MVGKPRFNGMIAYFRCQGFGLWLDLKYAGVSKPPSTAKHGKSIANIYPPIDSTKTKNRQGGFLVGLKPGCGAISNWDWAATLNPMGLFLFVHQYHLNFGINGEI